MNSENRTLHPIAALTLKTLRQRKPGYQGLVTASGPGCFNVSVAPPNVERAVQILDALAHAAEERGYAIERTENAACLRINGERVELELRETIVRRPHKRTPEEMTRAERAKNSRSGAHEVAPWEPRWDHLASGKLVLQLAEKYHTGLRRMWSDGKRQRTENLLNDFMAGALAYAAAEKAAREERERFHREWESEQRRRLAEEQQRQREESRWKFLVDKMEALERAEKIEGFVGKVKAQLANAEATVQLGRFLEWSEDYAANTSKAMLSGRP